MVEPVEVLVQGFNDPAAKAGRDRLVGQHPEAAHRAWVAITTDPTRLDGRQHPLEGSARNCGHWRPTLSQWQYEILSAGRVWYAIDDGERTIWVSLASIGRPRQTDKRRR